MQIPYRKPGKFSNITPDPFMTEQKFESLTEELRILKAKQPAAAAEVSRLAELGDFSENAEYQLAKGRLRGINNAILRLTYQLDHAEIIKPTKDCGIIELGSTVTVEKDGKQKKFQILGSTEAKPHAGVISYQSPIGEALIGCAVGETVDIKIGNQTIAYTVVKIE